MNETWASEIESFQRRNSLKAQIFGYAGTCRLPLILNVFPSVQMKTQRINPKGVFSTCTYSHDILKTATMEHLRSYSDKWSWPLLTGESLTENKQKDFPPPPVINQTLAYQAYLPSGTQYHNVHLEQCPELVIRSAFDICFCQDLETALRLDSSHE